MKLSKSITVSETKVVQIDLELPHYSKRDYYGAVEYWRIGERGQITRISVDGHDSHIWSREKADHDWTYKATSGEKIEAVEFWNIYARALELLTSHLIEPSNEHQGEAQGNSKTDQTK